jgi:hypothetical protein
MANFVKTLDTETVSAIRSSLADVGIPWEAKLANPKNKKDGKLSLAKEAPTAVLDSFKLWSTLELHDTIMLHRAPPTKNSIATIAPKGQDLGQDNLCNDKLTQIVLFRKKTAHELRAHLGGGPPVNVPSDKVQMLPFCSAHGFEWWLPKGPTQTPSSSQANPAWLVLDNPSKKFAKDKALLKLADEEYLEKLDQLPRIELVLDSVTVAKEHRHPWEGEVHTEKIDMKIHFLKTKELWSEVPAGVYMVPYRRPFLAIDPEDKKVQQAEKKKKAKQDADEKRNAAARGSAAGSTKVAGPLGTVDTVEDWQLIAPHLYK